MSREFIKIWTADSRNYDINYKLGTGRISLHSDKVLVEISEDEGSGSGSGSGSGYYGSSGGGSYGGSSGSGYGSGSNSTSGGSTSGSGEEPSPRLLPLALEYDIKVPDGEASKLITSEFLDNSDYDQYIFDYAFNDKESTEEYAYMFSGQNIIDGRNYIMKVDKDNTTQFQVWLGETYYLGYRDYRPGRKSSVPSEGIDIFPLETGYSQTKDVAIFSSLDSETYEQEGEGYNNNSNYALFSAATDLYRYIGERSGSSSSYFANLYVSRRSSDVDDYDERINLYDFNNGTTWNGPDKIAVTNDSKYILLAPRYPDDVDNAGEEITVIQMNGYSEGSWSFLDLTEAKTELTNKFPDMIEARNFSYYGMFAIRDYIAMTVQLDHGYDWENPKAIIFFNQEDLSYAGYLSLEHFTSPTGDIELSKVTSDGKNILVSGAGDVSMYAVYGTLGTYVAPELPICKKKADRDWHVNMSPLDYDWQQCGKACDVQPGTNLTISILVGTSVSEESGSGSGSGHGDYPEYGYKAGTGGYGQIVRVVSSTGDTVEELYSIEYPWDKDNYIDYGQFSSVDFVYKDGVEFSWWSDEMFSEADVGEVVCISLFAYENSSS